MPPQNHSVFHGLDPIFASEVLSEMGITPEQIRDTRIPPLLRKVVMFLKEEPNWHLTLNRILTGKPVIDPLKFVAEYADLRVSLARKQMTLAEVSEKLDKLKLVVDEKHPEYLNMLDEYETKQREVEDNYEEVRLYEK